VQAKVGLPATEVEEEAYIPTTRAALSVEIKAYEYTPRSNAPTKQNTSQGNTSATSMAACPPEARLRDTPGEITFRGIRRGDRMIHSL
jgi:hypothetical protein